jgi:hypothetical protein
MKIELDGTPAEIRAFFNGRLKEETLTLPREQTRSAKPKVVRPQGSTSHKKRQRFTGSNKNTKWTAEDDAIMVRKMNAGEGINAIARELGRTRKAVYVRMSLVRKGLVKTQKNQKSGGRPWTEGDTNYLMANFDKMDRDELGKKMNRHPVFLTWKLRQLGVKKENGRYAIRPVQYV